MASHYGRTRIHSDLPNKRRLQGFTLFELMVTLCIVSILASIALPGFRKTIQEFRLNAFVDDYTDLIKVTWAYRLTLNEWPEDKDRNVIPPNVKPFLPKRFYNNSNNYFIVRPLRFKESCWDFDNWLGDRNANIKGYYISARDLTNGYLQKAKAHLQTLDFFKNRLACPRPQDAGSIMYKFPEV